MLWAYFLIAVGLALDGLPIVADIVGSPEIAKAVTSVAGPYAAHAAKVIGIITALARIRSLKRGI